jgi:alkyl hydroperoxide reductase subunit AhpF
VNNVLEADRAKQYGIDRAPGIAVVYEDEGGAILDSRIRFLGAPAGYEFISLVQAVLLAGGGASNLSDETRARLAALDQPAVMQVFTTPT